MRKSRLSIAETVNFQSGLQVFSAGSEESAMGAQASFQEILEDRIQAQGLRNSLSAEGPSSQDPAHLAYLLGTLNIFYFRPPPPKIYPAPAKCAPRPHVLTEDQQAAFDFLNSQGAALPSAFTRRELKRAFRGIALKVHPDMNKGTVGPFIQLKNHYETLAVLFN